jgi:hypothetical protein
MQRSKKRKRKTLLGEKKEKERSVLKNSLTTPALLEMSGKTNPTNQDLGLPPTKFAVYDYWWLAAEHP